MPDEQLKCKCCEAPLAFRWCDIHGVGVCCTCGLPHRIYHYETIDGKDQRVEKPPSVALSPIGLEIAKRYWREEHAMVFPGSYDMGISRGDHTYSGASIADCKKFGDWYKAHKADFPVEEQAA